MGAAVLGLSIGQRGGAKPSTLRCFLDHRRAVAPRSLGSYVLQANASVMLSGKRARISISAAAAGASARGVAMSSQAPSATSSCMVPGLLVTNHVFHLPLDYSGEMEGKIQVFAREVTSTAAGNGCSLPYLLYLQGGPGFEAPRPVDNSGWLKAATQYFRVVLLDQRGTGRSSPIRASSLTRGRMPEEQAKYLAQFRADNIVRDAEMVRKALVPSACNGGSWSILGQSFGGFCCVCYLCSAAQGLSEVLMTGGIPPDIASACPAEEVYTRLYRRVILQNEKYYSRFPEDEEVVRLIVEFLHSQPEGGVRLPSGTLLTPRAFQLLGLSGLGQGGGFERLHYLLEGALLEEEAGASGTQVELSPSFIKAFEASMPWDTNPLYAVLHESIYCQPGVASAWAAHRVREHSFQESFDAVESAKQGKPVLFTGEMVFPWMFDDFACLKPFKPAAELLAAKADWPLLYDAELLRRATTTVPCAAASYFEDMYVDYDLAQRTVAHFHDLHQWTTSEYQHSGIKDDGVRILERLLKLTRGTILRN